MATKPQPKTYIAIDGQTVDAADVTVPQDRRFRAAWNLSANVIGIDMTKARDLTRDRIRAERAAYWPEIDKQRWDAEDANDNTAKAAAKTLRQKMKDAPTHASIVAAATPEALKAITLQTLLA